MARDLGAASLATGHYARRLAGPDGPELHRAADAARDQSYFLYRTTRAQLDLLRFPLGAMGKDETRALARRYDLPVAAKPDSQDICFVPDGNYAGVVERLRPEAGEPGDIVDLAGTVLGRHRGLVHFTVGQRKGIGIAVPEPLYVVRLEPEARRVVVGPRAALAVDRVAVGEVNWLGASPPLPGMAITVKLRSAQPPMPARLDRSPAPTGHARDRRCGWARCRRPGRRLRFYDGDRVLGGGVIRRAAGRHFGTNASV